MSGISEMTHCASGAVGAVGAGGKGAVSAGISILRDGGNAADAAVASVLALAVTDYGSFSIGGEVPFMFYEAAGGRVNVLAGVGAAPRSSRAIRWYYENGIPRTGDIKATPVPGAPDLCITALRLYGTRSFEDVAAPVLALLDDGAERWHANLAATFRKLIETERKTAGSREEKLAAARDRFYKGDIAEGLERFFVENGGFLTGEDLAAHVTRVEEPVSVPYRGHTIFKCGPWTQGPYLCQTLRLLEGFNLQGMTHLSAEYVHLLAEALKLAFADRDEYYADPLFAEVPLRALLSERYAEIRRELIDSKRASGRFRPGHPVAMKPVKEAAQGPPWTGGTTTCVVGDRWGNVVAATPSANPPYAVCEELGVAFGNRLRSLNTTPGHPNRIEAGKRPRITLTPTIATRDGEAILAVSVAGGDLQDQTTLNCLLNHIEFGMMPERAVAAPRFHTGHHQDSFRPDADRGQTIVGRASLSLDDRIAEATARDLAARGHEVKRVAPPVAKPVMLHLDCGSGMIHVAGDPRAARHAAALP